MIEVVSPDPLQGWGPTAAAGVAVLGLGWALFSSWRDRHWFKRNLRRDDHLRYLLTAAEQYARYRAAPTSSAARVEAETHLKIMLRFLPDGIAVLLKNEFKVATGEDQKLLPQGSEPGAVSDLEAVSRQLAHNAKCISEYGKKP